MENGMPITRTQTEAKGHGRLLSLCSMAGLEWFRTGHDFLSFSGWPYQSIFYCAVLLSSHVLCSLLGTSTLGSYQIASFSSPSIKTSQHLGSRSCSVFPLKAHRSSQVLPPPECSVWAGPAGTIAFHLSRLEINDLFNWSWPLSSTPLLWKYKVFNPYLLILSK